jgi:hypothetical protein
MITTHSTMSPASMAVVSDDESRCSTISTRKRGVRFISKVQPIPIASPLEQLNDWTILWYQQDEMNGFRDEANLLCSELKTAHSISDRSRELCFAFDEQTRGLEQRLCPERRRRKCVANKIIVKTQFKLQGERLAQLAQRVTSWATQLAAIEGDRDYQNVHEEQDKKRPCVAEVQCSSRRVRQRV